MSLCVKRFRKQHFSLATHFVLTSVTVYFCVIPVKIHSHVSIQDFQATRVPDIYQIDIRILLAMFKTQLDLAAGSTADLLNPCEISSLLIIHQETHQHHCAFIVWISNYDLNDVPEEFRLTNSLWSFKTLLLSGIVSLRRLLCFPVVIPTNVH